MASIRIITMFGLLSACAAVIDRPASYLPPNNLAVADTPFFIVITTDDSCDRATLKALLNITQSVKNPNNCYSSATFFCTVDQSTCSTQLKLHTLGHEVATHTLTHPDLYKLSSTAKKREILGARDYSVACGLPKEDVVGFRAPFLSSTPYVRSVLKNNGFLYDASLIEIYNSPSSPSSTKRLYPYSLYQGIKQLTNCKTFDNVSHCSPYEKWPGLWEVPMYEAQTGSMEPACADIMDCKSPYTVYKREFDRNYANGRTHIGIYGHYESYFKSSSIRKDIVRFLKYARTHNDVWVVTMRQLVDWMQNPVPKFQMNSFMSSYTCTKATAL